MTLKNVPDDLYEQLKRRAELHRRSITTPSKVGLSQRSVLP
jgi:plasmid stability protein